MSGQAGRYQRSFGGMVGAMAVLVGVVLVFVVLRDSNRTDPADPVRAIEYVEDVAYYRTEADFPLLAPPTLPEGWIATSQEFVATDPQSWHLGVLTDDREYVGLEQSADSVPTMVDEFVDDQATKGDPVTIDGVAWESYSDEGGDVALVREVEGATTLVVGTVPLDELTAYVRSLR